MLSSTNIGPSVHIKKKQLGHFISLKHNIYVVVDSTSVDGDCAAHAGEPTICTQRIMTTHLL